MRLLARGPREKTAADKVNQAEGEEKRSMKKFIVAVMTAALFLGVGAGASYAYLTAQDGADNPFRVSSVDIGIEENFKPPGEVTPGQVITKAPRLRSSSDTDCYVRMSVRFSSSEAEALTEPLRINAGWQKGQDGFYYWQERLAPGATTGTLFDSVKIREDARADIPPFRILVYAEAVACKNLSMNEAWEETV